MEKLWNFFSGDLYEPWNKNDVEIFLGRDTRDIFNVTKQNVPEDFMARVKKKPTSEQVILCW